MPRCPPCNPSEPKWAPKRSSATLVSDQTFHPSTIASLYHVMTLNARLEDFVIRDIYCETYELEGMREALAKIPPLEFSCLRRICIVDSDISNYPVLTTALNPKIITTSDSWRRCLDFSYVIDTGLALTAGVVPQQNIIAPYTLAILGTMTIASDGRRCLHLNVRSTSAVNPLDVFRATMQPSEVHELWLSTKDRRVASFLEDMQKVTTLVFPEFGTSAVAVWLREIAERKLFPKLEEVRVWARTNQDGSGSPLLGFLKHRQNIGKGVHTLRFLRHPETPVNVHCTFDGWKAEPKKFRRVAHNVVFEEPKELPRMELPDVCNLPWPLEEGLYPLTWPRGVFC